MFFVLRFAVFRSLLWLWFSSLCLLFFLLLLFSLSFLCGSKIVNLLGSQLGAPVLAKYNFNLCEVLSTKRFTHVFTADVFA